MHKQIGILIFHLSCMNYGVWVVRLTSFKWKSNFELEVFQKFFDDLDNFTWPYGVCLDAWNVLKLPGMACSNPTATCLSVIWNFVILMPGMNDSNNFQMMFRRGLDHWFGQNLQGLEVGILTPLKLRNLKLKKEVRK